MDVGHRAIAGSALNLVRSSPGILVIARMGGTYAILKAGLLVLPMVPA